MITTVQNNLSLFTRLELQIENESNIPVDLGV